MRPIAQFWKTRDLASKVSFWSPLGLGFHQNKVSLTNVHSVSWRSSLEGSECQRDRLASEHVNTPGGETSQILGPGSCTSEEVSVL